MSAEDRDQKQNDEVEQEQAEVGEERQERPAKRVGSAQDFLGSEIVARAQRAQQKLRSNLVGTVAIELSDSGERYLFDWSSDVPNSKKIVKDDPSAAGSDCKIKIHSQHLMKVINGDLNPQVGMLSDKIHVEGKLGLAIYFFNLVTPMR